MVMTPEEIIEAKSRLYGGLDYVLEPGERVLVIIVGSFRQAVVGTDRRLLVYKAGNQAGAMFSRKAMSWSYDEVADLRLDIGVKSGVLTVVPHVPNAEIVRYGQSGHGSAQQSPNAITFASKPGTMVAARTAALLEMVAEAHGHPVRANPLPRTAGPGPVPRAAGAPAPPSGEPPADAGGRDDDPIEAIRKLGELREAGLVTDEEFLAKKTELLKRI